MIKRYKSWWLLALFFAASVIMTYPAFSGHFMKLTMDGGIHLSRMESIFEMIKMGKLPPLVNFIGLGNHGNAFNGMYPWVSMAIFFVLPRFFLTSPMHALFASYVLINIATLFNAYLLTRELSKDTRIRLFATLFYGFNAYHLTLLFSRNAVGEALAYTFAPLVLLGCFQIWRGRTRGILHIALGMGMIANSHVISLFLMVLFLVVLEFSRLILKKITWQEIINFVIAGGLAVLIGFYSITNIIKISRANHLYTPGKKLVPIQVSEMVTNVLNNSIQDKSEVFNIGLIGLGILLFLLIQLFRHQKLQSWNGWGLLAIVLFILTTAWLPFQKPWVINSIFGNIQFLGRILSLIILSLVIAITLYLTQNHKYNVFMLTFTSVLLIVMGIGSVSQFHWKKNDDPIRYYVNNKNLVATAHTEGYGFKDYAVANSKGDILYLRANTPIKKYKGTGDEATFVVNASHRRATIPINLYKNVEYQIYVDGKKIKQFKCAKILSLALSRRNHKIKLIAKAGLSEYITMLISVVSMVICSGLLLRRRYIH
ncbi:hypothetical protein [Pediococcus acidilactici]|jgi:MFS family permease|uniref:hypothetical protein n=1 Tax=Pediococcus acidilactici TaxID=1254 RepID=UPI00087907BF|nr:hypothetical protein [Pediococcus acidilactici]AOW74478.1 hypothetical protein A4V11_05430 [Pediococcus acidilactici]APR29129.1 hypothetical protein BTW26_09005 [Pediococcus acidilactici]KAF0415802.1 hypothetical protein GBO77_01615 [Pediococcus acidilactici]MCQ0050806.1 hypothetical protein [Pediococcus acidilactici]MCQ0052655.1 hypothetical protein [Pediococcus acidilactici]